MISKEISYAIHVVRGKRVMLDSDLAKLYGVATGSLNLAVKRNEDLFGKEFAFQLTPFEYELLVRKHGVKRKTGTVHPPLVYTWQGLCLVSFILNSRVGICVHIQIIRVFVKMKRLLMAKPDTLLQIENIEINLIDRDEEARAVFTWIKKLLIAQQK